MKYLLITPCRYSLGFDVLEFATDRELLTHIEANGIQNAMLAQRLGVQLQVCDWPVPTPESTATNAG